MKVAEVHVVNERVSVGQRSWCNNVKSCHDYREVDAGISGRKSELLVQGDTKATHKRAEGEIGKATEWAATSKQATCWMMPSQMNV